MPCHGLAGYLSLPSVCFSAPILAGLGPDILLPLQQWPSRGVPAPPTHRLLRAPHPDLTKSLLGLRPWPGPPGPSNLVLTLPTPSTSAHLTFQVRQRHTFPPTPLWLPPQCPCLSCAELSPSFLHSQNPFSLFKAQSKCLLFQNTFQEVFCCDNFSLWAVVRSPYVDLTLGPLPKAMGREALVKVYCTPLTTHPTAGSPNFFDSRTWLCSGKSESSSHG